MVTIVGKRPREDGQVEVTLSQDGTRFVVVVPAIVDEGPDAFALYQIMANGVCRQANTLDGIIKPGGAF